MRPVTAVLIACIALGACAVSSGTNITSEQLSHLQAGKTTISQVIAEFGEPSSRTGASAGVSTITYTFKQRNLVGNQFAGPTHIVVLAFAQDGTFVRYNTSDMNFSR